LADPRHLILPPPHGPHLVTMVRSSRGRGLIATAELRSARW
jgi:hypothetical protein